MTGIGGFAHHVPPGTHEIEQILDAWRLPRPRRFRLAAGGYQNATLLVSCAAGEFVLRVYTNVDDPSHQRFEHELLRHLATAELPFAVPRPLPSEDGDTLRVVGGRLAALFARIPGELAGPEDTSVRRTGAIALAELDDALARIERFDAAVPSFTGDLAAMHPLVDDLASAAADSGLDLLTADRLAVSLEEVRALSQPLYASLPQQVTHGDFGFGNLLIRDGRIVGFLDFEHSGRDVRAMDLAVGLFRWSPYGGDALERCDEFGRAYCGRLALDPTELAALPALLRLRAGVSFVHWLGRLRSGLTSPEEVRRRAARALVTRDWVDENGEVLVARALGWIGVRI